MKAQQIVDTCRDMPVIKEHRLPRLLDALRCIRGHPFDRDAQRDCVLALYIDMRSASPEHADKSVFRGMVLPSLRHLGLIVGESEYIRLSADGHLICPDERPDRQALEAIQALFADIDSRRFGLLSRICRLDAGKYPTLDDLSVFVPLATPGQRRERIISWVSLLASSGLATLDSRTGVVTGVDSVCSQALDAGKQTKFLSDWMRGNFFPAYKAGCDSAGICDIEALRIALVEAGLRDGLTLTTTLIDSLVNEIPVETPKWHVSFGSPMGWIERPLLYRNRPIQTILLTKQ